MDKKKLIIAMQILKEFFIEFSDTIDFIDEKLKQKCAEENISVGEVIYFLLLGLYFDSWFTMQ